MKAIFQLTNKAIPPTVEELTYDTGKTTEVKDNDGNTITVPVMAGGFTLLSSPDDPRDYEFDTTPEMIEKMKTMRGFTFVRLVEEAT